MRLRPLALCFAAACASPEPTTPEGEVGDDEIALFRLAADRYDVPRDLLVALAWHETSFSPGGHDDEIESQPSFGWLGLSPDRLAMAADLVGADASALALDPTAPLILEGAAVLADLRDTLAPEANSEELDAGWWPVVLAWTEFAEEWMEHDYARDVFFTLQAGLDVLLADGRPVEITARRIPGLESVEFLEPPIDEEGARANTGYPGRTRFLAAHASNQGTRSGGTGAIRRIVIHTTEGSYNGAISWFQNASSHVSAHYVVRRSDGEITQMVGDDGKAFHACRNNDDTIGIEHEGTAYSSSQWTAAQVDASARLTGWLVAQYDIPIDRDHIVGHGEIQPSTCAGRDDPGTYFPWTDYLQKVATYAGGGTSPAPAPEAVSFLSPQAGAQVTSPVQLVATHPGTDHIELWSGPLLIASHRSEDPVTVEQAFPLGARTLTIRGYAEWGALLIRRDIQVTVVDTLPGDDDTGDDDTGDDDDSTPVPCDSDVCVGTLPFAHSYTTTGGASIWDAYACAPDTDESGPERVYRVEIPADGVLTATVSDGAGVDVDVHILSSRSASSCLARGHLEASAAVEAGAVYVSVDSWVGGDGTVYDGDYSLSLSLAEASTGNCAMLTDSLARIGTSTLLAMPATGPVVKEAHLVTVADGYGTAGSGPWPQSMTENIANHYAISQAASGYAMTRTEPWCPAEGGQIGQAAYYAKVPVLDEAWYINMYWSTRPPGGTRMIVQANGLAVVASAGFETGPGNLSHIAGVSEEIHDYLGTQHLDTMTVGFAVDNTLPLGPITCD